MSNLETRPTELVCGVDAGQASAVQVLTPRDVPLGGPRAMTVRRTLPQRDRSLIGAWCFLDHYGPDDVATGPGMVVPPHPHTGLQTVSWLFSGEIEHRDSAGNHALVRPGELNLMTAGRGISHSEVSTPRTTSLHGVQLWLALPDHARFTDPGFTHHVPEVVQGPGYRLRVFLGELVGSGSPVPTWSPLLGAEIVLDGAVTLAVDEGFEHGVLVDSGRVDVDGVTVVAGELAYRPPGSGTLRLAPLDGGAARVVLLGGAPFGEPILMWWNFVGRSHEEVVAFRRAWQVQIGAEPGAGPGGPSPFGTVAGSLPALPAPMLPDVRLRPRANPERAYHPSPGRADPGAEAITLRHLAELRRYEVLAGGRVVGSARYAWLPERNQVVLRHTEVDEAAQGRGLAARLVRFALDDVRMSGRRVVPQCPYVAAYLARHPGDQDLVDPVDDGQSSTGLSG